ncbi:YkvA family protein [Gloeocapsa sp. PCC 73106]|uniref:YkvA family protein n=1 Tax=Gloeocapsa sp. PCC 73106 TaxID=102232 RepID=UPI0002AC949D|nr:YkvA family protein [Gloeocapsa sp. PCC 73106]ELR97076.1 hypothetical protein GLO73106DRAFT_00008790 [Gloeocapsa sp. PCC 73106]
MRAIIKLFYNWYGKNLRNSKYRWALIVGGLLYLVTPTDISPDFLPILGWLDDGVIITLLLSEFSESLLDYRNRRRQSPSLDETIVEVETV